MRSLSVGLLVILAASSLVLADPAKTWSPNWSASFTEQAYFFLQGNFTTTGKFMYDAANHRLRVTRVNGKADRYCGTVYPMANTPCEHLVVAGKRLLVFPEKKYCCSCCEAVHGCGFTKPDWIKGGELIGQVQVGTIPTNMYLIKGLQDNFYAETIDGQIPAKIYMSPNTDMIFKTSTYAESSVTDADFALPGWAGSCEKRCPVLSICTAARMAS